MFCSTWTCIGFCCMMTSLYVHFHFRSLHMQKRISSVHDTVFDACYIKWEVVISTCYSSWPSRTDFDNLLTTINVKNCWVTNSFQAYGDCQTSWKKRCKYSRNGYVYLTMMLVAIHLKSFLLLYVRHVELLHTSHLLAFNYVPPHVSRHVRPNFMKSCLD